MSPSNEDLVKTTEKAEGEAELEKAPLPYLILSAGTSVDPPPADEGHGETRVEFEHDGSPYYIYYNRQKQKPRGFLYKDWIDWATVGNLLTVKERSDWMRRWVARVWLVDQDDPPKAWTNFDYFCDNLEESMLYFPAGIFHAIFATVEVWFWGIEAGNPKASLNGSTPARKP